MKPNKHIFIIYFLLLFSVFTNSQNKLDSIKVNTKIKDSLVQSKTIDNIILEKNPQLIFIHIDKFTKEQIKKDDLEVDLYRYENRTNTNNHSISLFGILVESIEYVVE